jgi:hypothetical protein
LYNCSVSDALRKEEVSYNAAGNKTASALSPIQVLALLDDNPVSGAIKST